ncbi:hypothetical protein [Synoicihabitans lomoniglobus]|uniref:Phage resistance protein n=1 Tax=Synoicihabitans lomoniglobus TaxID=2909285 RepID=A0AAE9ZTR8_9BACT|nr:hypothetical protein [Opitutaceae bacterium LMO-M01]WED64126.1 hypothetical protein PXH66_17450 [Opitutaceae bacterium LMO-M01]
MTFIKDLIQIPDHVGKGDFVLRLSEGVTDPAGTVRHYQVTPQLVKCFDEALKLVKGALTGSTSRAAYLHGSFGSGKSHFMAILHLLLQEDPHARSIPELADVIASHNAWTQGKKLMLVPYHLIGAKNLESAILGGYAAHIHRNFPDAPTPAVFKSEGLLANGEQIREGLGDEKFFAKLNATTSSGGTEGGGGWGNISATWTATTYDAARHSSPTAEAHRRLVRDLVETHLPAMRNTDEFVDLDDGLAIMSAHAKEIGYDGLILFLDELILWLASYAADPVFVSREGQKVVKLVESERADRPVPVISFVARQRDLRDLVGQHVTGAERLAFADVLNHHDGRFGVIKLEDRNLPAIAAKRILAPIDDTARLTLDDEFNRTAQVREEVMNTLLTRTGNKDDFRKLYPFSPALVETLVAVSSVLQRERTALKVMALLMVEQRETLQLGQIVPVGDLFDQVSQGDEAFSADMKIHFENAHRLYELHLKPLLEKEHDLSFEQAAELPFDDSKRRALRNDDRLMKTLLLAALVPEVEALKAMTPGRLAALNHGTIKSPIPGQEGATVLNKFKKWAAAAGQIKIRESAGGAPTISLQLSGVDAEQILAQAESVDNPGNRIRKLKELLFEQMGVAGQDELFFRHKFRWKGTERECDLHFGNLREFADETIQSDGETWKLLIDYPFDQSGHSVRDDLARMEKFQEENGASRTMCWLPSFFGHEVQKSLGVFVRLEQILKDNQFPNFVQHLNQVDRDNARGQLENQRSQLKTQLMAQLEMAYGLRTGGEDYLDPSNSLEPAEQFLSLDPAVQLQPPVAANMADGVVRLLEQALGAQYPGHPNFEDDAGLTKGGLAKVLEVVRTAVQNPEPSIVVEQSLRKPILRVAVPLKFGEMGEMRFQIGDHWKKHFIKQQAQSTTPLSVGKLRKWIDLPLAMGLPAMVQDLVILAYAEQTNRVFKLHGASVGGGIGDLPDEMVLEEVALPAEGIWTAACERAKSPFGLSSSPLLNATNLDTLAKNLVEMVTKLSPETAALVRQLTKAKEEHFPRMESCTRLDTIKEADALLKGLGQASGNEIIKRLAGVTLQSSSVALAKSMFSADEVIQALAGADWKIFQGIRALTDERKASAAAVWRDLETAIASDEYAIALGPKLALLKARAIDLLTKPTATPPPPPPPPTAQTKPVGKLKALYGRSQAEGDGLPEWVEDPTEILTVHMFGAAPGEWNSLLVVTPTLKALIELDPQAEVDLAKKTLKLPRFGQTLSLSVKPEHLA